VIPCCFLSFFSPHFLLDMSFGRPPNVNPFKVTPPDRGSFPLDHEGMLCAERMYETRAYSLTRRVGLCKDSMMSYMHCLQANQGNNGACRDLSERYLKCRMQRGLMMEDDMRNLGFRADEPDRPANRSTEEEESSTPGR
jgi:cytochrome c oxidase assembly protein subunit 19